VVNRLIWCPERMWRS